MTITIKVLLPLARDAHSVFFDFCTAYRTRVCVLECEWKT